MGNIINTLVALSEGKTCGNKQQFESLIYNGIAFTQNFFEDMTNFHDNGQVISIYVDSRLTHECNYTEYYNQKIITSIYSRQGCVFTKEIDFDSKENNCLGDISDLKAKYPKRWIYKLEAIYNKYGCDIVNSVRESAYLFCM